MSIIYYRGCEACDLRKWINDPNTDLEAANPPVLKHTCPLKQEPERSQ